LIFARCKNALRALQSRHGYRPDEGASMASWQARGERPAVKPAASFGFG
jgi:hypothetical protein